ncbi:uncharacterized protein YdiU (UPF0061 family) [Methylohalomonas lacus]|uniref:Protein nucleotidyltransferase YdiU n=2 Tax=Methylohalomonas lacus TaxID=398773 RepID=A0AAE3HJ67_9GAMM|nr:uncharacterized protein YdiU (UPF0061 family) [Methylohalomonas lacus]
MFAFRNSYAQLPEAFYRLCEPTPVAQPALVKLNRPLAEGIGLELGDADEAVLAELFAGNCLPADAAPLATAYAGHQFGNFVPQLGDGRAILLGEVVNDAGERHDIQLKGAGRTPFSRGGDGRAPAGPAIREYLLSEAMHALGVPTTRALALVTTGEPVMREEPLPGAVLTRVAASHVRVGTFQFFAARGDTDSVRQLADHVIARHYPDVAAADNPYRALLEAVSQRQAELIADWMAIGFIHGVMNTDNMSICGETLDYGPCAFMDHYHPETVFSSIDRGGRYAYKMQPAIAQWNITRLAECLLPLIDDDEEQAKTSALEAIEAFMTHHQTAWLTRMRAKLGLVDEHANDQALIDDLLAIMATSQVDFTVLFRGLADAVADPGRADVRAHFTNEQAWDDWAARWAQRLQQDSADTGRQAALMRASNPAIIPRNHRIEQAIDKVVAHGDFSDFHRLDALLAKPFADPAPADRDWMAPPAPEERVRRTFCGT